MPGQADVQVVKHSVLSHKRLAAEVLLQGTQSHRPRKAAQRSFPFRAIAAPLPRLLEDCDCIRGRNPGVTFTGDTFCDTPGRAGGLTQEPMTGFPLPPRATNAVGIPPTWFRLEPVTNEVSTWLLPICSESSSAYTRYHR